MDESKECKLFETLKDYDDDDDTSFFVRHQGEIVTLYQEWTKELPNIRPYYAMKCSPQPELIETLASLGAGFDCASQGEMELVFKLGVTAKDIIYANPCKQESHIKFSLLNNVKRMTFDNIDELTKMSETEAVLRIFTQDNDSLVPLSEKYGATMDQVPSLLRRAIELNISVIGVSFHVGSGCQDPEVFVASIKDSRRVFDIASDLGLKFYFLDIGGGFYSNPYAHSIGADYDFTQMAKTIRDSISTYFQDYPLEIIAEPGRYFAASCFSLVTKVIARNLSRHPHYYYLNDGRYMSLANDPPPPRFIIRNHQPLSLTDNLKDCLLWGPTCSSVDRIGYYSLPELEVGDQLVFWNMGAYTFPYSTDFNGLKKPKIR